MHARAHQDRAGTGIADAGNSSVVLLLVQGRRRRAAMLSLPAPAVVAGRTLAEQQSNDQWRRGRRCGRRGPDRSGFAGRHATDADADAVNGKQLLPGVTTHHCLITRYHQCHCRPPGAGGGSGLHRVGCGQENCLPACRQ